MFLEGERADHLAESDQLAFPDLLVLKKGGQRLVLLFNETDTDKNVMLRNPELHSGQQAQVFESGGGWVTAESLKVHLAAGDTGAVFVE